MSLDELKAKQRYRVRRGLENVEVCKVDAVSPELADEIYLIAVEAFAEYPESYRPQLEHDRFTQSVCSEKGDFWLCREKATGQLCGYAICHPQADMVHLSVVKVPERFMKLEVNAAVAYQLCDYYLNQRHFRYICDGERNLRHQTGYQDFLCRVLNFRYAYCRLHVVYHPLIWPLVKGLYPFRNGIKKRSSSHRLLYNLSTVLMQEEIVRKQD
ncbi:MAG: hypothetical protein IJ764_03980 [Bacteroidales bacterium]|nr:hypothetical protein [Bacteroidales bacterium]